MRELNKKKNKANTRYNDEQETKILKNRVIIELPSRGKSWNNPNLLNNNIINSKNAEFPIKRIKTEDIMSPDLFSDLPISRRTLEGLKAEGYYQMTLIQRNTLPHSLQGRDIIGQARTGSGKTLAFVIPILENIYRDNHCSIDGLLSLILTPTRELASQVFDVIKEIGKFHSSLSAGCIVGGKDIKSESSRINMLNILVATPGRLIQHMDESPLWEANNLKILVIDEVDRMLDMGFLNDIKIILDGIPSSSTGRQTMVFSATVYSSELTITKIENLFRTDQLECFSLDSIATLPKNLQQLYIKVAIHEKIDTLFNFLRTHSNKKIIVFVSCCKQVRFLSTVFTKLKIGSKVLELHGKQSLQKRLDVVHNFYTHENLVKLNEKLKVKNIGRNLKFSYDGAVLFCTDIASRGLDFPKIDWVIQLDIPENVDTYIHRIGRTARYVSKGKSLLFVMDNENYFLKNLCGKGIDTLKKVTPKEYEMRYTIHSSLQSICASDKNIREMAERAFSAYIKSLFILTPNDKREELKQLDFSAFALSLGLAIPPKIKINIKENEERLISKHSSKLQKFKEKMKQKKLLKNAVENKDINSNRLNILHKNKGESIDNLSDDIILYSNSESTINQENFLVTPVNERTVIDKLRFRSDCSGKIRGHGNFDFNKQHIFFSDDEEPGAFSEDNVRESSDIDCQRKYIEQVKSRLKCQTESDKERDRERVHEMHVKKRRVSRQCRKEKSNDVNDIELIESGEEDKSRIHDEDNLQNLTTAALEKLGIQISN
ncbi:Hca4p helicase DBP4 (helicase CA4) EIF4A-1-family RNA SFII helicase [Cryptosporidium sp. chipmunk genotype I]|uniref:Hca4p helicase DBP4 (helicase CA4) EIF4A-1-family RNA SFII helicase n=1 Tax=Cryptosporidium sp. chipmunk genotype I TaxID=1280935 RepID=UPI00351A87B0|nr:Hca4p helicase DBP4 (helicase CA4) EIF4A-1-family RNA SFII helicase [Cryptosporidium sp. chipmunk genotype I]